MLNEIKEFEQYNYPLDSMYPSKRLKHKKLCNDLSGIARAMTIIARKSFFDYKGPGRVDHVKNDLQVWCGDPKGDSDKASNNIVDAWLPEYMIQILVEEKALKFKEYLKTEPGLVSFPRYKEICSLFNDIHTNITIETFSDKDRRKKFMQNAERLFLFCKELGSDEKQRRKTSSSYAPIYRVIKALNILTNRYNTKGFAKEMFNTKIDRLEKNDYKKIMYDKIIADAITEGSLKRYYLVCENADLSEISYISKEKEIYPFKKEKIEHGKEHIQKKLDLIMKTIAAFLLEQKFREVDNKYDGIVPVNFTDISNWLAGSTGTDSLKTFRIENRPLFVSGNIDNVGTIGIDSQWMQSCGWKIISEDKLDDYLNSHPDAVFYSDFGAGEFLRKNIRYT